MRMAFYFTWKIILSSLLLVLISPHLFAKGPSTTLPFSAPPTPVSARDSAKADRDKALAVFYAACDMDIRESKEEAAENLANSFYNAAFMDDKVDIPDHQAYLENMFEGLRDSLEDHADKLTPENIQILYSAFQKRGVIASKDPDRKKVFWWQAIFVAGLAVIVGDYVVYRGTKILWKKTWNKTSTLYQKWKEKRTEGMTRKGVCLYALSNLGKRMLRWTLIRTAIGVPLAILGYHLIFREHNPGEVSEDIVNDKVLPYLRKMGAK